MEACSRADDQSRLGESLAIDFAALHSTLSEQTHLPREGWAGGGDDLMLLLL